MNRTPSPAAATLQVGGSTELLFVVANPVAQVKAPQAYNLLFAQAGIDAVVVPAQVSDAHLAGFVREALATGNVRGLFVSIPHKTRLLSVLDRRDVLAQAAGAANAVRRAADGALEGALFDGIGFVGALQHHGVPTIGRRALLLGAGGAGLAIASALGAAGLGLAELAVFDAQAARAEALAARLAADAPYPVRAVASNDVRGFGLVIQATPLGLQPNDPLPLDPRQLEPGSTVMDILMTRRPTALERACAARGITAHPGHEMMLQQMPPYLEFFGYGELARLLAAGEHPYLVTVRAALLADRARP